jgi:hypothetical protein
MQEPRSLTAKYLRGSWRFRCRRRARRGGQIKLRVLGRDRAQPEGRRRRDPAQHADLRHRRQRLGQVDARARRALRGDQAREGRLGSPRRRVPRSSKARSSSPTSCSSIRRRSAARRARIRSPTQGVRSDPRAVRATKDARRAADREPLLVQRARRPLRGVPGRRRSRVEMQFLADVFVPCDQCDGKRFKPQVLEVKYRGKNVTRCST